MFELDANRVQHYLAFCQLLISANTGEKKTGFFVLTSKVVVISPVTTSEVQKKIRPTFRTVHRFTGRHSVPDQSVWCM